MSRASINVKGPAWRLSCLCGCQSVGLSACTVWHCLTHLHCPSVHQGSQLVYLFVMLLIWPPSPLFFFKAVTPPPPLPVFSLLGYAVSFLRTHSIQNSATEVNRCFLYYINISFDLCLLCFLRYDNLLFFCYFCFSSSSYSQHIITDILTSPSHN